jgi:predicted dinucleotide-binding enzyme
VLCLRPRLAGGDVKRSSLNDFHESSRDGSAQLVANLNRVAELIQSFKQVAADRISSDRRTFDLEVCSDLATAFARSMKTLATGLSVRSL